MLIKHDRISIKPIKADKLVLNPKIDPESEFISIAIFDYIEVQPFVEKGKFNTSPFAKLLLDWNYTIESKTLKKELLVYKASDSFILTELDREGDNLIEVIKESYGRFSGYFDTQKAEYGIRDYLPELSESEITPTRQNIIDLLRSKAS